LGGQDSAPGTRRNGSPAADPEDRRSTEQVKLRLRPADAARLRAAATSSHAQSVSEYVVLMLDTPERVPVFDASSQASLAIVANLTTAIGMLPEEAGRCRGELGRAFGLLKHLFEQPASAINAERHAYAIAEATREARAAMAAVEAAVEKMGADLAPIRRDLGPVVKALAVSYAHERAV
jgi:hypothetical protein